LILSGFTNANAGQPTPAALLGVGVATITNPVRTNAATLSFSSACSETLLADAQRSKLLCFAALDVLEIQHEHGLTVCRADGIAYDERLAEEYREVLAALRFKVEHDLP
jgi:hypothetical protein